MAVKKETCRNGMEHQACSLYGSEKQCELIGHALAYILHCNFLRQHVTQAARNTCLPAASRGRTQTAGAPQQYLSVAKDDVYGNAVKLLLFDVCWPFDVLCEPQNS